MGKDAQKGFTLILLPGFGARKGLVLADAVFSFFKALHKNCYSEEAAVMRQ